MKEVTTLDQIVSEPSYSTIDSQVKVRNSQDHLTHAVTKTHCAYFLLHFLEAIDEGVLQ